MDKKTFMHVQIQMTSNLPQMILLSLSVCYVGLACVLQILELVL